MPAQARCPREGVAFKAGGPPRTARRMAEALAAARFRRVADAFVGWYPPDRPPRRSFRDRSRAHAVTSQQPRLGVRSDLLGTLAKRPLPGPVCFAGSSFADPRLRKSS